MKKIWLLILMIACSIGTCNNTTKEDVLTYMEENNINPICWIDFQEYLKQP